MLPPLYVSAYLDQNVGAGTQPSTDITADGYPVEFVKSCVYPSNVQSTVSQTCGISRDALPLFYSVMASLKEIWRDQPLLLHIKICSKHTRHLFSPPFCTLQRHEPYVLTAEDVKILESFHSKFQRPILGIRWHDHVWNVDVANHTGLLTVTEQAVKRSNSISVTSPRYRTPSQSTKLCDIRLIYHSVDCLANRGSIVSVVLISDGWIKSVTETVVRRLVCGEMLLELVIRGRRNGPRRSRDKDNQGKLSQRILTVTVHQHRKSMHLSCAMTIVQ